jgi:hypothetical protein
MLGAPNVLVDRIHETNRIGRMEAKPIDLILERLTDKANRKKAGDFGPVT